MNKLLFTISLLIIFFVFPNNAFAKEWFYPMDSYFERQSVKGFGTLINDEFYKGKETLFPFNRFYGYHAAVDLEVIDDEKEKKIPVYAVGDGPIIYIGVLPGYGGVILQKLTSENRTALYGHVKTTNLSIEVSDIPIKPGQLITYLGDTFSSETSKERKHLHFGIYKGADLYFKGHEASLKALAAKWENPSEYLKERHAKNPTPSLHPEKSVTKKEGPVEKNTSFLYNISNWIRALFLP